MNTENNITISSHQNALRVPRKKIAELVNYIAARENINIDQLDFTIVADEEMAQINWDFLQHEGTTDVITFDLSDEFSAGLCGQIVISSEVAIAQGPAFGHTPTKELLLYVAHGMLHLLGYDDLKPEPKKIMHARQAQLLEDFLNQR